MSGNTLTVTRTNGEVIDASHINELTLALLEDFVGRNTSGIPAVGKNLGTLALPWGNLYAQGIILNGSSLDLSNVLSLSNRIVSGKTRSLSSQADFIRANGAALSFQVLGLTTNLVLAINNTATTVNTDITKTGITAAPSTNNTCLVNDTSMSNDKYAGEDNSSIFIDTVGSEITALVGQYAAFKNGTEILLAYVKSTTELTNVFRGFFFDSSGNPLTRQNLSDNSTLTLMKIGWVFIENNGTTVDVTYKTPVTSYTAPTSPSAGDYWFDITNQVWKRYSGTQWDIINRMLIGSIVSDATNTIASRSFDFYKSFSDFNNVELEIFSTEVIRSKLGVTKINVNGTEIQSANTILAWNITTDLESPLTEASSTYYYLYISDKGQRIISNEKPYNRKDLKGYYHPYHTWRCLGDFFNDGSSNIVRAMDFVKPIARVFYSNLTGFGSTGTTTGRFSLNNEHKGTTFNYVADSVNGDYIEILKKGLYACLFSNIHSTSNHFGGTVNSLELATNPVSINYLTKLTSAFSSGNECETRECVRLLNKGDKIRFQSSGSYTADNRVHIDLKLINLV